MMSHRTVCHGFVKPFLGNEKRGQLIRRRHQVHDPFQASRRCDAVGPDTIIVQAIIDNADVSGVTASLRGEQIILVQDAFLEPKAILHEERPLVQPEDNAHESKVATDHGIVVIILHPGGVTPLLQVVRKPILSIAFEETAAGKAQHILPVQI